MRVLAGLVAVASVAGVVVFGPAASASPTTTLIEGSGSAWASNAVNQSIADVSAEGLEVVYSPNGSVQGREDFANVTTDFAVTDLPYQGQDPVTGTSDTSEGREYGDLPLVAGGVSFPYHLVVGGKPVTNLRLSGLTLLKIFSGSITNWDSPEITSDNNGHALPSQPITPVIHAEQSAVSADVSGYFSTTVPTMWKAFAGQSGPVIYFPRAADAQAENGSDAVMNYVASAAAEGSIGMDEYTYALGKNYPVAAVRNAAGYYVIPSQYNVAIALRKATIDENSADATYMRPDLTPVYNATDKRAYPLSYYASMLIPVSSTDPRMTTARRQTIADFAYYSLCQGQQSVGTIGYSPLPLNLVQAGLTQIDRLNAADSGVDVGDLTVANCHNPTFLASDPGKDLLGQQAPEPPACSKQGAGPCGTDSTTALSISASARSIPRSAKVKLIGRLSASPEPTSATIELQRRRPGSSWTAVRSLPANADGAVSTFVAPTSDTSYRLTFAASDGYVAATSPVVKVVVIPTITAAAGTARVAVGHRVAITGEVRPDAAYRVDLQRFARGRWRTVLSRHETAARYRLGYAVAAAGARHYRVEVLANSHFGAAVSPRFTITGY